ncbi:hypothetical protein C8Q72DRAFT_951215 [Fomitopsis betulina]|nr:hypothetical protein C8Q72DRAFT_951215 [Fomitopsis betulina]
MSNAFNSLLSLPDSSPPSSPLPTTVTLPDETATGLAGEAQTTVAASSAGSVAAPDDPPVSNRQPAEDDLVQYADQVARRVRLRPAGQQELRGLVMLTMDERIIWIAAHILRSEERLEAIQPADAQWVLPKLLKDKIDIYSYLLLVSPSLSFYVKQSIPVSRMKRLLEHHPQWGYTTEVRNDTYRSGIVMKRIQDRLTDRHAELKHIGQICCLCLPVRSHAKIDILTLCEAVIIKHSGLGVVVKPTLEMCARFALLCRVLVEVLTEATLNVKDYWDRVDEHLDRIRGMFLNEPRKITKLFMNILEADKKDFGSPTAAMPAVMGADPTMTLGDHQAITDDAAGGFSSNLRED